MFFAFAVFAPLVILFKFWFILQALLLSFSFYLLLQLDKQELAIDSLLAPRVETHFYINQNMFDWHFCSRTHSTITEADRCQMAAAYHSKSLDRSWPSFSVNRSETEVKSE